MSNSNKLQPLQESNIQIYEKTLKISIALAFERTNTEPFNVDNMIKDVLSEFKDKDLNIITDAIKRGSLGYYGRTYRMSTQEVCLWIREYLKTTKKPVENWNKNPYTDED